MLEIDVVVGENYDEETRTFGVATSAKVRLEHSLVSLSKWESLWEVSFLNEKKKTHEQTLSYIEVMLLDDISPEIFTKLVVDHLEEISKYIESKQTATTVPSNPSAPPNNEIITAELIYYWMISLNIPMECQYWHLSRLLTLVKVVNFKNDPKKTRMSAKDRRALNRARRQKLGTSG